MSWPIWWLGYGLDVRGKSKNRPDRPWDPVSPGFSRYRKRCPWGISGRSIKLSTNLQLVSKLGMRTVVLLLPNMLSWRGHWQLEFYYVIMPEILSHSWTNSSYCSPTKLLFRLQELVSGRIFTQHLIHCYQWRTEWGRLECSNPPP